LKKQKKGLTKLTNISVKLIMLPAYNIFIRISWLKIIIFYLNLYRTYINYIAYGTSHLNDVLLIPPFILFLIFKLNLE